MRSRSANPNPSTDLFHFARGLGAIIDAAMAGIEHDQGPGIRCLRGLCRFHRSNGGIGVRDRGTQFGTILGRQRLDEGGPVHLLELQHQPRRLAVGRLQHIGIGNLRRTRQVEHDSRAARHHEAISERLDQTAPCRAGTGRELEIDLGNIDDDAIGVGQREGAELNGPVEIEDETGLFSIARQAGAGSDREIGCRRGGL